MFEGKLRLIIQAHDLPILEKLFEKLNYCHNLK